MSITQAAHAELAVRDIEEATRFHVDVLGMLELGRENGSVHLGCGVDDRCDLVLTGAGTGVRRIALEVESDEDLARYASRLGDLGVRTERRSDEKVGVARSLGFNAPNGLAIALVLTDPGPAYLNPGEPRHRGGVAPIDFDHITLKVPEPDALVDFLTGALDFAVSDEMRPSAGVLVAAWTRAGMLHHDIAMFKGPPDQTLHHYALRVESFDHLKQAADRLAQAEVPIEAGPGRHRVGGNVYLFFWTPGGNRCELSAEMPRVGSGVTKVWQDLPRAFSVWGAVPPPTFADGS